MANLRKHSTEDLWKVLYRVRQSHESDKLSVMQIIGNLVAGQLAIIGILNRQKKEQEKYDTLSSKYGARHVSSINYRFNQPQGPVGYEEAPNVADPTNLSGTAIGGDGSRS